jgi:hypothetical protein
MPAWLIRFFQWLLSWFSRKPSLYRVVRVPDIPDQLKKWALYVAGEDGYDWSAVMLCPCGCGKTLEMNLLPDTKPVWKLTVHADGTASLHPSVWLKTGCGCHFFLRGGRVRWV